MAKMCPMNGCKASTGLCLHDKMMIVMGAMGIAAAVLHWGMQVF